MQSKTLYVTDLDGTFLNSEGQVSEYALSLLDVMEREGIPFTINTGRTLVSCRTVLRQLKGQYPIGLVNGAALYDPGKKAYIETFPIPSTILPRLTEVFRQLDAYAFLYALDGNGMKVIYRPPAREMEAYYHDRIARLYRNNMEERKDYLDAARQCRILVAVLYGKYEDMRVAQQHLEPIEELTSTLYENIYDGYYYIDIYSADASKGTAALRLKELCGAREVVTFGDNHNDIPMLKIADRSYAVSNAVEEAKLAATAVIGPHTEDSVARFIARDCGLYLHPCIKG